MASSKTEIANMALSHVGSNDNLSNLDTDTSAGAKACRTWYDEALRQALAAYNWSFARKRATLADHGEDADEVIWAYRHQYPADCVQFRYIENPLGRNKPAVPHEIQFADDGTRSILSNEETPVGIYTFQQNNVSFYTPGFVLYLSWVLASLIAWKLTKKQATVKRAEDMVPVKLAMASAEDANQDQNVEEDNASWTLARA